MTRKLRAPVGTDEANYGENRYRVDNDGIVEVPDAAAQPLMDVGGFVAVDQPSLVSPEIFTDPVAKLKAPEGATTCSWSGDVFDVDSTGHVHVPAAAVGALVDHGFTLIEG
jgi:hypothetical protein